MLDELVSCYNVTYRTLFGEGDCEDKQDDFCCFLISIMANWISRNRQDNPKTFFFVVGGAAAAFAYAAYQWYVRRQQIRQVCSNLVINVLSSIRLPAVQSSSQSIIYRRLTRINVVEIIFLSNIRSFHLSSNLPNPYCSSFSTFYSSLSLFLLF